MKRHTIAALILTLLAASPAAAQTAPAPADLFDRVTHGYATSEGGVKIRGEFPGKRRRRPPAVRAVRGPSGSRRRCLTHVAKPYPGEPGERRDP